MSSHLRRLVRPALRAATLAYFIAGNAAQATIYEVGPAGNDANAGTAALPWKTLQKASDTVKFGDTVLVNNGTYAGFRVRTSGTAASRIVFKAKTKWGAKINAPGPKGDVDLIAVLSASYVTIDGFEVFNAPRAGVGVRSWFDDDGADTQGNIVQNCFCHDNGLPSGGAHDGIFTGFALNFTAQDNVCDHNGEHGIYVSNSADNPIVRRNTCSNNRACGIQLNADIETGNGAQDGIISNWLVENNVIFGNGTSGGAGINLDGDINGVCRNNLIYNNLASGIAMYQIDGGVPSQGNLIVNNTIYNPGSNRGALVFLAGANNNVAFNNIFISGKGMDIDVVSGFAHDYNIVSSFVGAAASAHEASATAASLFKSVAGSDYHLAAASPALNSGVAAFGGKTAPATDLENHARPAGAAFDRGCYETVAVNNAPVNLSLSPGSGSSAPNAARSFTSDVGDINGGSDLSVMLLRASASASGSNAQSLVGYYNARANRLYLLNDAGTVYTGGYAPGSANVISNSQGSLNCAQCSVSIIGNHLTVNWSLTPAPSLSGQTLNLSLYCKDAGGLQDGWDAFGTWHVN